MCVKKGSGPTTSRSPNTTSQKKQTKKEERGGKIIVPKQEVLGVGSTAIATDPEGNQFALMQPMYP
jgi:predicted enzyme related to lactoylglutathione lyase